VAKSGQLFVIGCALAREQHVITSSAVRCQLPIMDLADEQLRQHSTEYNICLLDRAATKPHYQTVVRTCNRARWNAGQPEQKTMVGRLIQASTPSRPPRGTLHQRLRRSCISDFVARATWWGWVAAVSDLLQESRLWLGHRFGRLELVAEHAELMLGSALDIVRAELEAIRAARTELNI